MVLFGSEAEILSISSALLFLLLNAHNTLGQHVEDERDDDHATSIDSFTSLREGCILDEDTFAAVALHNVRLCSVFYLLDEALVEGGGRMTPLK
jgi:hypothetical protein